ncbi:PDZ domain-containing protein [Pseudoalteromonas sp. KG3]|uniref:PDZ domain-containing protein n=1 Tax=Pseudoalteromonas sp. KG3 TaxID=2951137 RepID=UPI00265B44CA|nr:PDZ domain-containing protein [Pseudoalteromonas sp. KG3]WKD22245.1 PDZ domain-containing protein [Pseudoalteromonas sp. KG3]
MARGVHELNSQAKNTPRTNKTPMEIEVYTQDNPPPKPVIYIANVAAHGNGYADNNVLLTTLKEETAKVGAELVFITNKEISRDEIVGTYGGGFMMSNQIKRPHLYGVAGVYSKVRIGITAGDDGIIKYIDAESPADKAGLREGMRLLSINGKYFNSTNLFQKEVSNKLPGDVVVIEYLDHDNNKTKINVELEPST